MVRDVNLDMVDVLTIIVYQNVLENVTVIEHLRLGVNCAVVLIVVINRIKTIYVDFFLVYEDLHDIDNNLIDQQVTIENTTTFIIHSMENVSDYSNLVNSISAVTSNYVNVVIVRAENVNLDNQVEIVVVDTVDVS